MDADKQIRYNRMHCTKCGENTNADLVGFNFTRIFTKAFMKQENDISIHLMNLDLKFYYTLRDICQELHFDMQKDQFVPLNLTVKDVIKQIEYLMKPVTFDEIKNSNHNTLLYNTIYEKITLQHGTSEEKMEHIEMLIRALSLSDPDEVIVSIPMLFIFDKDDLSNVIPIGIRYSIDDKIYEEYERICPGCGMTFDDQAGYHHEFVIGLAGLSRVGKTAYLASLVYQLMSHDNMISIVNNKRNQKNLTQFYNDILKYYEQGQVIPKTEVTNVSQIPLLYLELQIKNKVFNFVFVDMPGEIYNDDSDESVDFVVEKRRILRSADMLWCCIEPSMINTKYHNYKEEAYQEDGFDQLSHLIKTLDRLYIEKLPACVILTQCDLLKDDYPGLFHPSLDVMEEYISDDYSLDMSKADHYIKQTRQFLKQMSSLEPSMEDVFEGFSMFGIASYGFDVHSNILADRSPQPSMVELPFLWTLAFFGCLDANKTIVSKTLFGRIKEESEKVTDKRELYI
ncbi:MAG: hypothetical protein LUG12_03270 [Erysipelotrichaceae bacterium]|nr:hypothetical protein [Erysipelotrichaceae bacterium]